MTRSKNDAGSAGHIPVGQTSSGPSRAPMGNKKTSNGDGATRFADHKGPIPGVDNQLQPGNYGTSTNFEGHDAPNRLMKGSPASEPDPSVVNRGYSQVVPSNLPATSNPGANRQNYHIDPGTPVLDGNGPSNVDAPDVYFHPGDTPVAGPPKQNLY